MRLSSVTTCAARAKAASVAAASPAMVSTATFDAHASHTATAPAAIASVDVTTAGSGSHSTVTRSAPSRAASAVSATTIATGSPTKRTRSTGRGRGFATKNGEPSGLLSGTSCGFVGTGRYDIALSPSATRSAPVNTASRRGQRNANGGESTGPIPIGDAWGAFAADQLGLMDHLGIQKFFYMGYCIGGPCGLKLIERAPDRMMAAVLCQPVGHRLENPDVMYNSGRDVWGPELRARRPEITEESIEAYLHNL